MGRPSGGSLVKPELDCEKTFLTTNTRKYVQTAVKFELKYAYSVDIRHRSLLVTASNSNTVTVTRAAPHQYSSRNSLGCCYPLWILEVPRNSFHWHEALTPGRAISPLIATIG
eukprot:2481157-Rhodomonas_salina.1